MCVSKQITVALEQMQPSDPAAIVGEYAAWIPPLSYFGMHQMQNRLGRIDPDNKCLRARDVCETVTCPEGQLKKSCAQINFGCQAMGMTCPLGYTCLCSPCEQVRLLSHANSLTKLVQHSRLRYQALTGWLSW